MGVCLLWVFCLARRGLCYSPILLPGSPTQCVSLCVATCYNNPLHLQWVGRRDLNKYKGYIYSWETNCNLGWHEISCPLKHKRFHLLCTQDAATQQYPERQQASPHLHCLHARTILTVLSHQRRGLSTISSLQVFRLNICCIFPYQSQALHINPVACWFIWSNCWRIQIFKFLCMKFCLSSSPIPFLMTRYNLHTQPTFLLLQGSTFDTPTRAKEKSGFIINQKVSSSQPNGEYYLTRSYCSWPFSVSYIWFVFDRAS